MDVSCSVSSSYHYGYHVTTGFSRTSRTGSSYIIYMVTGSKRIGIKRFTSFNQSVCSIVPVIGHTRFGVFNRKTDGIVSASQQHTAKHSCTRAPFSKTAYLIAAQVVQTGCKDNANGTLDTGRGLVTWIGQHRNNTYTN